MLERKVDCGEEGDDEEKEALSLALIASIRALRQALTGRGSEEDLMKGIVTLI